MHVSARTRLRRVHVSVRVYPDQSELPPLLSEMPRYFCDCSDGNGMIAAEHQRSLAFARGLLDHGCQPRACMRDLREITRV